MRLPYKSMSMPVPVVDVCKTFGRSRFCFQRLHFTISRWRVRYQRFEQMVRNMRHFIDCAIERVFIRTRRFGETAQLANELERRRSDLVVRRRGCKIMQGLNVSAHEESVTADAVVSKVESITRMKTDFLPTLNSSTFQQLNFCRGLYCGL